MILSRTSLKIKLVEKTLLLWHHAEPTQKDVLNDVVIYAINLLMVLVRDPENVDSLGKYLIVKLRCTAARSCNSAGGSLGDSTSNPFVGLLEILVRCWAARNTAREKLLNGRVPYYFEITGYSPKLAASDSHWSCFYYVHRSYTFSATRKCIYGEVSFYAQVYICVVVQKQLFKYAIRDQFSLFRA